MMQTKHPSIMIKYLRGQKYPTARDAFPASLAFGQNIRQHGGLSPARRDECLPEGQENEHMIHLDMHTNVSLASTKTPVICQVP